MTIVTMTSTVIENGNTVLIPIRSTLETSSWPTSTSSPALSSIIPGSTGTILITSLTQQTSVLSTAGLATATITSSAPSGSVISEVSSHPSSASRTESAFFISANPTTTSMDSRHGSSRSSRLESAISTSGTFPTESPPSSSDRLRKARSVPLSVIICLAAILPPIASVVALVCLRRRRRHSCISSRGNLLRESAPVVRDVESNVNFSHETTAPKKKHRKREEGDLTSLASRENHSTAQKRLDAIKSHIPQLPFFQIPTFSRSPSQ